MGTGCRSRLRQRGSILMLYTLALGLVIVPMVGLAIDMGVLYIVQARLWAAVDGAALGAGRLIGTPADPETVAKKFIKANFRPDTWNTPDLALQTAAPCGNPMNALPAGVSGYAVRSCSPGVGAYVIDVEAQVRVPLLFLRILNVDHAIVGARGQATRRDSRIVLALDRSMSISLAGKWGELQNAATTFTQSFRSGIDRLGLVLYGSSAVVAYPNYVLPYNLSPNAAGGPNTSFNDGSANDMVNMINNAVVGSDTATADALWLAYIELQKGHMTDLNASPTHTDGRLNAIVLFTDGYPTQVTVYFNNPNDNTLRTPVNPMPCTNRAPLRPPSPNPPNPDCSCCTNNPAIAGAPNVPMVGTMGPRGTYSGALVVPPMQLWSLDSAPHTTLNWVKLNGGVADDAAASTWGAAIAGCRSMGTTQVLPWTRRWGDLKYIPLTDKYGNHTLGTDGTGTAIQNSRVIDEHGNLKGDQLYQGAYDKTQVTVNRMWAYAAWQAVDDAGWRIRTDAMYGDRIGDVATPMRPRIFTIALLGNTGVDASLLKRLANTQDAPPCANPPNCPGGYHDSTVATNQETGLYVPVFQGASISAAFQQVASEILRLAQ